MAEHASRFEVISDDGVYVRDTTGPATVFELPCGHGGVAIAPPDDLPAPTPGAVLEVQTHVRMDPGERPRARRVWSGWRPDQRATHDHDKGREKP